MADAPTPLPLGGEPTQPTTGGRVRNRWRRHRARVAAHSKTRRRLSRVGIGVVLVVVLALVGSGVYVDLELHRIGRINDLHNLKPVSTSGTSAGADDILLVGSTNRCAVAPAKNFQNFVQQCENGVNGINSDVIMILRLVPNRTPTLLSIPRDTFVPNARSGGLYNKVDAALADGPDQLIAAIEQDFGIPINHYVVLNFESFSNIVHALGGITMYFPTSLKDAQSGLDISHPGCLHISGLEALALVRARHLQYHYDKKTNTWLGYDGSGDIGRIERVHVFLKVLAQEVAAKGIGDPVTDAQLLSSLAPDLTVDAGFSTSSMLKLVLDYHQDVGGAPELTLPIIEDTATYYYKGYNYGDVVFPAEPEDQQAIDEFMGGKPVGASLGAQSISVSVVDASGTPSATAATIADLKALGYPAVSGGSATSVGPISETTVRYSSAAHLAQAERVLRSLSGTAVLALGPTVGGADVSVLTGSDLSVDEPGAATVSSSSQVGTTTSPIAALLDAMLDSASSPLTSPTPATTSIPPDDPRACPKS